MLSGMFFSVAGFTHLSFIRQGYYQGYYHFSALLWNKIPAKYPCCPGCFSLWQDLFCCLLSDKDINNKLMINFLLTIRVLRDVFLSGKIDSLVYYPTRILYHYIIVLYYYIIHYIILLLCCRRYFSRWQDLLSITRQGYYPRSGRAVKLKPKGDSTSWLHPV